MISACSKVEDSLKKSMDRAERRQRRLDQKQNWGGGGGGGISAGKRKEAIRVDESVDQRGTKCADCGSEEKKLIRRGPSGPGTLCNSCGLKWASNKKARNATRHLQDISSEGESVEDIVQERGADMYIKDLERKLRDLKSEHQDVQHKLHVSEARADSFRKLNEQRQQKIDELQHRIQDLETLVESLKSKIKEISSPTRGGSSAAEAECLRLRAEVRKLEDKLRTDVRCVEDRNRQLMENLEFLSELLNKSFTAGKEILAQSILVNAEHKTPSWRSDAVTDQQQQNGQYQESKKASNFVKNKYEKGALPGFHDVDADVDADIGDNETVYHVTRRDRGRSPRIAHEDPIPCSNKTRGVGVGDTNGRNRDQEWERPYHGGSADRANGVSNGVARDRRSEEVRGHRKDAEGRPEKATAGARLYGGCSGEDQSIRTLVSHDAVPLARQYVEQSFITWLNSKLRKPTPEEMEYHKTRFTPKKSCYWSGIPGSEILAQYADACPLKQVPDKEALELVLSSILHVEACPMRPNDVLWCLVWQDCMKIEQLPGYHDYHELDVVRSRRELRRPLSPVAGVEDSDRSLRQRYTYT